VLIGMLGMLIHGRYRPATIFCSGLFVFILGGQISAETAFSNLTNPALLALVLLMLVAVVLDKNSLLQNVIISIARHGGRKSLMGITVLSGLFSGFLNNTAIVAALIGPLSRLNGLSASQILIPLSYASILGGTLTLVGTSTNLLVSSMAVGAGMPALGVFSFLPVGLLLLGAGLLVIFILAPLLMPNRRKKSQVSRDYLIETYLSPQSKLIGKNIYEAGLRSLDGLFLVEIMRDNGLISPVSPEEKLRANDVLLFAGNFDYILQLSSFDGLHTLDVMEGAPAENLVEVMVSNISTLVGKTIKESEFRSTFDAAVVAAKRHGELVSGKLGGLRVEPGDLLVLAVGPDFHKHKNIENNFYKISEQEPPRSLGFGVSFSVLASFLLVIAAAASGIMELLKGLLLLLVVYMLAKLVRPAELRRYVPLQLILVVASSLGVAQVLFSTGVADQMAVLILVVLHGMSPAMVLVIVLVLTMMLTELVTNNAAAALIFPLAVSIASQMHVEPLPFVMAVAFGASASFITPYGYQTNLMVFTPGEYKFIDYVRMGVPVSLMYLLVASLAIPHFFPINPA
jgi:di/tricarboxylate transporter